MGKDGYQSSGQGGWDKIGEASPGAPHAGSEQDRRAANVWCPQPSHSGVLGVAEVERAAEVLGWGQGVLLCCVCWEAGLRGAGGVGEGWGS